MRGIREGWTKHPWEWLLLLAAIALLVTLAVAPRAHGDFHLTKIRELSGGTADNTSYIELQMYAPGQNKLAGHRLTFWNAAAFIGGMPVPIGSVTLSLPDPSNGENQRTVLIGDTGVAGRDYTAEMSSFFDQSAPQDILPAGAVCFEAIPIDCVSWGGASFSGVTRIPDHSEPHPQALPSDFSLRRRIDRGSCVTALDPADDTNDNAVDFVQGLREPTANIATPTETVCPTVKCGGLGATKIGTAAHDVIVGTAGKDVIAGLGGPDIIRGLAGNDVLCGGGGPDKLVGGGGRDRLLGQAGRDTCNGGPKRDIARKCETKRSI